MENNKELNFEWRVGDYEIKACPRRLVRFYDDEPNETINFCKWETDEETGKRYKFSVAYFTQDKDGYWDLKLVGNRFFEYVAEEDYVLIMKVLKTCHQLLNDFSRMDEI